jgi:geranylgeranyl pyrophosphate synthase
LAVGDYLGLDLVALSKVSLLLELLHVSSLIHDDLPALDNDDLRRGKPSCHKVYGEGHSILLGDFLIAEAYSIVANNVAEGDIVRKLVSAIGSAYSDLCLGQVLDLELRGKNLEQSEALIELERINALKTGALFELSVRIPLIISRADEKVVSVIEEYSRNLGLLFQLSDDILDASSDVKAGKEREINYIDVLGVTGTEARAEELVQSTIQSLNSLHDRANDFLHQCVHFARGRKD